MTLSEELKFRAEFSFQLGEDYAGVLFARLAADARDLEDRLLGVQVALAVLREDR